MDLQLEGKTALVSGSTAGIGFAIAAALVGEGACVIVNGRTQQGVDGAVKKLASHARNGGQLRSFAGDLTTAAAAEEVARLYPEVNILVNNLGISDGRSFEEMPDEAWRRLFEGNVLGGVRLARLFLPAMRQRNWGRIIFISSDAGLQVPPELIAYGMTKAAGILVARGLAELVAGSGITVNSVLPGPTKSRGAIDFLAQMAQKGGRTVEECEGELFPQLRSSSLIKRLATPDEVASLVAYVASPLASATTGAALRVDGGCVRYAF